MMNQFATRTSAFSGFHSLLWRHQQQQQLGVQRRIRYSQQDINRRILSLPITTARTNLRWFSSSSSSSSSYANVNKVNPTNSTTANINGHHQRGKINLRNATINDISLLEEWDKQPHIQDPNVMGDEEYNDWNWEYELSQDNLPTNSWRRQYIADLYVPSKRDESRSQNDNNNDGDTTKTTEEDESNITVIPIGFIQIIDPLKDPEQYWGKDMVEPNVRAIDIWIGNPTYIGKGYGTEMMKLALECDFVFGSQTNDDSNTCNSVEVVLVDPMYENIPAHKFYQKLGFQSQCVKYFGPDKCLVHRLTRKDYFSPRK